MNSKDLKEKIYKIDKDLSRRNIELDPQGYFIIKIDQQNENIIVEHYLNNIDDKGFAVDPQTNKLIDCNSNIKRTYNSIFTGKTAKELGILITEQDALLISKLDHALYLGRELQKAEQCLLNQSKYIQD